MLASIQSILQGIGTEERDRIAESARLSGNRMVRAKLPQSFRDIHAPTHLLFEELAIRAETDEMDGLARFTAELMNQCVACHAAFRVH